MENYEKINKQKLIEYFEEGCKKDSCRYIGLELEHFIVDRDTKAAIGFYGEQGIEHVLKELGTFYDSEVMSEGHLIGLSCADHTLTLEPGAQMEISIAPQKNLREVMDIYERFHGRLNRIISPYGYNAVTVGYQPASREEEISMIPKERYSYMYRYFEKSGTCGKYMMKSTAATQVSIDYKNEAEFRIKYRAACMLAPVFSLITDNSPVFEGRIYEDGMLRQYIWDNVDNRRVHQIKGILEENFGFEQYADFVYDVPQIVARAPDGQYVYTKQSAREFYAGRAMDEEDVEQALSMVFPDVRLKKYIEIRVADSLPIEASMSYLALIRGAFCDAGTLKEFMAGFERIDVAGLMDARRAVRRAGIDAKVFGKAVTEVIDELFQLSASSLQDEDKKYLSQAILNGKVKVGVCK